MAATAPLERQADWADGLDHRALFTTGMELVQQLAREVWTDFNPHDPGITTLELLCYALTDLAYRASHPIADLLASADPDAPSRAPLFTARQILPNRALTTADYRKLLIDLPGVKNVWLQPFELTWFANPVSGKLTVRDPGSPGVRPIRVRGLHRVLIDFMDDIGSAERQSEVLADVRRVLNGNRNLCEDFVAVDSIATEEFVLCAEIDLDPDADTARTLAEIQFAVQRYLAPPVVQRSLADLLRRPWADGRVRNVADAFEGPALQVGFIDDGDLAQAQLRTEVRLSDLIGTVLDVAGARAVREMVVNALAEDGSAPVRPANPWVLPVAPGRKAILHRGRSRIVFRKRGLPVPSELVASEAARRYDELVAAARVQAERVTEEDLPPPRGRHRPLSDYRSVRHLFPAVYGLGDDGAIDPADSDSVLAAQFKAYLLFFDQIMANGCAQLARLADLFSFDAEAESTYFTQLVSPGRDGLPLYRDGLDAPAILRLIEDEASFAERRNRFLDHLIARFGEAFDDFAFALGSAFGGGPRTVIASKCRFLAEYPQISGNRGLAYDHSLTGAQWDSDNVSGVERRVAGLLGIRRSARRDLGVIDGGEAITVETMADGRFRFDVTGDGPALGLAGIGSHETREAALVAANGAIELGLQRTSYRKATTDDGRHVVEIVDPAGAPLARSAQDFDELALDAAIDQLLEHLASNFSNEGMYLIENLLLRPSPEHGDDAFLPICMDPNCGDCPGDDPYSYRVHVVLPAFAGRFRRMEFRRFAERAIRDEMPAHILPKICWIGREDMARLEPVYRAWIESRAANAGEVPLAVLQDLIRVLYSIKSVYETAILHECDGAEDQPRFVLGRTALGSIAGDDS